jgi:hypothetical protein
VAEDVHQAMRIVLGKKILKKIMLLMGNVIP